VLRNSRHIILANGVKALLQWIENCGKWVFNLRSSLSLYKNMRRQQFCFFSKQQWVSRTCTIGCRFPQNQTLNADIQSITSPRPYYLHTKNRPFLQLVSLPTHTQTAAASTSTFNRSCTQEHRAQTTFTPISAINSYKWQSSHIPKISNSKNFHQHCHTCMQLSEQLLQETDSSYGPLQTFCKYTNNAYRN